MTLTYKRFWILVFPILILTSCGEQISPKSLGYYKDNWGIYYSYGNNWIELSKTYLNNVDEATFLVLDEVFAKDKKHVYYGAEELKNADAKSFYIDKSGLPKDAHHVFVYNVDKGIYNPTECGIDIKTADCPIHKNNGQDWIWLRDKDYIYMREQRMNVDRNTFQAYGDWFIDKSFIYQVQWNKEKQIEELLTIDKRQTPLDTIPNSYYIRNGRNVIYVGKVVLHDLNIKRIKRLTIFSCIVNNMLLDNGKEVLKDTVDLGTLHPEGNFFKDKNYIYDQWKILKGFDAKTFKYVDGDIYKDKNGTYKYNYEYQKTPLLKQ